MGVVLVMTKRGHGEALAGPLTWCDGVGGDALWGERAYGGDLRGVVEGQCTHDGTIRHCLLICGRGIV